MGAAAALVACVPAVLGTVAQVVRTQTNATAIHASMEARAFTQPTCVQVTALRTYSCIKRGWVATFVAVQLVFRDRTASAQRVGPKGRVKLMVVVYAKLVSVAPSVKSTSMNVPASRVSTAARALTAVQCTLVHVKLVG